MREAELFVTAEQMLTEVLGRIREQDLDIALPPVVGVTGEHGDTLRAVVERHLEDDAGVPAVLLAAAAVPVHEPDETRQQAVTRIAAVSEDAARRCGDADGVLSTPYGELRTCEYLLRLTVVRSLVAHYVAAYLGSTACPLPEELARPLWELTEPDAAAWRATGLFREPLPIPELASWRDVFLRTAGHEPHPLGH